MKWLEVLQPDTAETVCVYGYECSVCGYVANRKWVECPGCREEWEPDGVDDYVNAMSDETGIIQIREFFSNMMKCRNEL